MSNPSGGVRPQRSASKKWGGSPHHSDDREGAGRIGNFADFETLFAELDKPPVIELGNPLPASRFVPKGRAGSCPAAHNRALLKEKN